MRILAFSLSLLLASAPLAARAADPLDYTASIPESSSLTLGAFLQKDSGLPLSAYAIAPVDLNGDGLEEFIARETSCDEQSSGCVFRILSETSNAITPLGEIKARSVMLGNGAGNGVRELLAFNNSANDYEYSVYVWEPAQSKYIMAEKAP